MFSKPGSDKLDELFKRTLNSANPFRLFLFCFNGYDGVGDFKHGLLYYRWFKMAFRHTPHVEIKLLTFVTDEKLAQAKFLLTPELADTVHYTRNIDDHPVELVKSKDIIVNHGYNWKEINGLIERLLNHPYIRRFLLQADVYLNVSVPAKLFPNFIKALVENNSQTFISSVLEYAPAVHRISHKLDPLPDRVHEVSMGIRYNNVGLYLNESMMEFRNQSFDIVIEGLENDRFKQILKNTSKPFIGIGYLQNTDADLHFVRFCLSLSHSHEDCVLFINPETGLILRSLAAEFNFGRVMEDTHETRFSDSPRSLYILGFPGISENDKERIQAVADIVAGSGDNSLSDAFTSKLPYIQSLDWKRQFVDTLMCFANSHHLGYLTEYIKVHNTLSQYYGYHYDEGKKRKQKIFQKIVKFTQRFHKELIDEVKQFRRIILHKKNVLHFLQEYLTLIKLARVMRLAGPQDWASLLATISMKSNCLAMFYVPDLSFLTNDESVLEHFLTMGLLRRPYFFSEIEINPLQSYRLLKHGIIALSNVNSDTQFKIFKLALEQNDMITCAIYIQNNFNLVTFFQHFPQLLVLAARLFKNPSCSQLVDKGSTQNRAFKLFFAIDTDDITICQQCLSANYSIEMILTETAVFKQLQGRTALMFSLAKSNRACARLMVEVMSEGSFDYEDIKGQSAHTLAKTNHPHLSAIIHKKLLSTTLTLRFGHIVRILPKQLICENRKSAYEIWHALRELNIHTSRPIQNRLNIPEIKTILMLLLYGEEQDIFKPGTQETFSVFIMKTFIYKVLNIELQSAKLLSANLVEYKLASKQTVLATDFEQRLSTTVPEVADHLKIDNQQQLLYTEEFNSEASQELVKSCGNHLLTNLLSQALDIPTEEITIALKLDSSTCYAYIKLHAANQTEYLALRKKCIARFKGMFYYDELLHRHTWHCGLRTKSSDILKELLVMQTLDNQQQLTFSSGMRK